MPIPADPASVGARPSSLRHSLRRLTFVAALLAASAPCWAACTKARDCTEWLPLEGGASRLLVYRSLSLAEPNPKVLRAVVVVHGAGRDADRYFEHMTAAAGRAAALDDTVVVAPRFASSNGRGCKDTLADREANWGCGGAQRWTAGGLAVGSAALTAYDAMDGLLRELASRTAFPNLKTIVLAGHSAGGQFVSRYQMANRVHDSLPVRLSYVVANPSSYAYLDGDRPTDTVFSAHPRSLPPGYVAATPAAPQPPFAPYTDAAACPGYDHWPYGLQQRVGYAAGIEPAQLRRQLAARPTTYLLGEQDVLPLSNFDATCPAMAQGPSRLARGLAHAQYVNERWGAGHAVQTIAPCGHDGRCMFNDAAALKWLFPALP